MMTQNNSEDLEQQDLSVQDEDIIPLDLNEIKDPELRAILERIEERIYSYADDVVDGWLGMAEEFQKARQALARRKGVAGYWQRWVVRFKGFMSIPTANRLAEIGELERSELATLRSSYFRKGSGISAIAAFLSAPEPIKEQVRRYELEEAKDPTAVSAEELKRAIAAFEAAKDAQKRAEEAERRAVQAAANFEEQIQEVRREAQLQGQLAVQQATAKLQREVDEARHQATLRQRDMEEAQQQIQRAQAEWNDRLAYAKKEERERLEADFTRQMRALQQQLHDQEYAARKAKQQATELNERLTHARDVEAVRARSGLLAIDFADYVDAKLAQFPSVADAEYFEKHERDLWESLVKRLEIALRRAKELSQPSATIVDAG